MIDSTATQRSACQHFPSWQLSDAHCSREAHACPSVFPPCRHTPSVQLPEEHSACAAHACPSRLRIDVHLQFLQARPVRHCASKTHDAPSSLSPLMQVRLTP